MATIRTWTVALLLLGVACDNADAQSTPARGSLEVRHTPLSRSDVPAELMQALEKMQLPYVRFYRTDVTNNTGRPVRVVWFDGFFRFNGPWMAANVKDRVLRTKDFLDWYGGPDLGADGWLRPGGTASCRVNWHWTATTDELPAKWAFVAVDAQGNDYFAEAKVPRITPVKLR